MGMMALQFQLHNPGELVIAEGSDDPKEIKNYIRSAFMPSMIRLWKSADSDLEQIALFTAQQSTLENKTTMYVCKNYTCEAPVSNLEELIALLSERKQSN